MAERNYPGGVVDDDPRFTIGLVLAVKEELERRGYPHLTVRDIVELQQSLFRFLYTGESAVSP